MSARLWHGVDTGGSAYAVKLTGGGTPAGLILAAAFGVPGVPAPVSARDGGLWSTRDGKRLSLVPWISSERGLDGMTATQWTAFGKLLAGTHAAPITEEIADVLPVETYRHERATDCVRQVHKHLAQAPDALDGGWDTETAAFILAGADRLAARLRADPAPNVVCHADPHTGNVLLGPTGEVFLIDWDDAIASPRERDLMFLLDGGLMGFADVHDDARGWFFEGYGDIALDRELVVYFQCVRALEDLDFALTALNPRTSDEDRAGALRLVRWIFGDTGLAATAAANLRRLGPG